MKTIKLLTFLAVLFFTTIATAQTNEPRASTLYSMKLESGSEEIYNANKGLSELSKGKIWIYKKSGFDQTGFVYKGTIKDIIALEDRIEFSVKDEILTLYYYELIDITFTYVTVTQAFFGLFYLEFKGNGKGKKFKDILLLIQHKLREERNTELVSFESIASQYCALKTKPLVSEEQRRLVVQANMFNEQQDYWKAIDMYRRAIDLDQTSYPSAYSNLALLSAQVKNYSAAIYYMKKYLLLQPDAEDARADQDKIYEWEAQLTQ
jgi:tetratricopeptide (TPR) repeat protein